MGRRATGPVGGDVDAVAAGAAVAKAPALVPRQVDEYSITSWRRARTNPAAGPGDDEFGEAHRAVRRDPVGERGAGPCDVDVRRAAVMADDLRDRSGLGQHRIDAAYRRGGVASLTRDRRG